MIKVVSKWGLFVLVLMSVSHVFAQSVQSIDQGLFIRTTTPASTGTAFPVDAGFFRVSAGMLSSAAKFAPEITRITNFPLGSKLVNLSVNQFDVLTREANISVMTSAGNKPFKIGDYVLLHGEVENISGSHVYIAVFPDYAIGYVEVPAANGESTRYLVQPTSFSSEAVSTMIVYKQDDVVRSLDRSSAWKCGTEELSKNFKTIDRVYAEIASESNLPAAQPQAAKVLKLLKVDFDCDYDYFLDFKSDTAKALKYVVANVGAVSDIYIRDLNAGVMAQYLHIWAVDDPFAGTTTDQFLPAFEAYGGSSLPNDNRTSAILLSGVDGIGGLAYLKVICPGSDGGNAYAVCGTNNNYVFPKDGYVWDVDVVSHEFGHNIGALHTHSCSWSPAIDSCVAAEDGSCFSTPVPVRGTIMSYCHLTPKGTELKFHTRIQPKMKGWITAAKCAPTVQLPVAIAGGDKYQCGTDSVTFIADGQYGLTPYTYSWRVLGQTTVIGQNPELTVKPSSTTTYVLTLTDANNLRNYDTVKVFIDKPKANAGSDIVVCGVGTLSLNGSSTAGIAPFTYAWKEKVSGVSVGNKAIVDIPVTTTKTYTLTITDSVGCQNSDDIVVTVAPKPIADVFASGPTTICQGDSVVLDAGSGFAQYKWSNGKTTQKIGVTTAGDYSVIVANTGNGCTDTSKTVTVTVNPAPSKPTITTTGDTLVAPSGANSYRWYYNGTLITEATASTYLATKSGKYIVSVGNSSGCFASSNQLQFTPLHGSVSSDELSALVTVFPNPANDVLNVEWHGVKSASAVISITDLLCKTMYSSTEHHISNTANVTIDIKSLQPGTYFLHYSFSDGEAVKKFIKQ